MRTADTIYQDLLPDLPGVPEPMVERALIRCAQELCRRARVWPVWTDPVTIKNGVTEYDMELPSGAQVIVIERATRNGAPMAMTPWTFIQAPPQQAHGARIVPGRISFQTNGLVDGDEVCFRAVLAPADNAPGVPDEVFDPYSDLLAAGIKSRLMLTPGQPFTNLELGAANAQAWSAGVSAACLRAWRGHTDGTRRSRVMWC